VADLATVFSCCPLDSLAISTG